MEDEQVTSEKQNSRHRPMSNTSLPKPHIAIFGLLGIIAIFLLCATVFFAIVTAIITGNNPALSKEQIQILVEDYANSSGGIASLYTFQFLFLFPLTLILANFKTQSWRETLQIEPVTYRQLYNWLGVWVAYQSLAFLLDTIFNPPTAPILETIKNTQHFGLVFVITILAPILEELIFRGYLYKAWRHTRLGASGTILITSVIFTLIHANQYEIIILAQLFIFSLILGIARNKTGSILPSIFIHAANNFLAGIMIVFFGLV